MSDLVNFCSLLPKDKQKLPIGYKNHMIDMLSNSLLNFIEKSSGEFGEIIICSMIL